MLIEQREFGQPDPGGQHGCRAGNGWRSEQLIGQPCSDANGGSGDERNDQASGIHLAAVAIPVARALGMTSVKAANVSASRTAQIPAMPVVMMAVEGAVGVARLARAVQAEPASATHNVRVRNAATPGPQEAVSSS